MKFFPPSLLTYLAVLISCIAWIFGISWFLIHLLDLSVTAGWMTVGILSSLSVMAVLLLRHEVLHAIELPDHVDLNYGAPVTGSSRGDRQSHAPLLPVDAAPAFRVQNRYH